MHRYVSELFSETRQIVQNDLQIISKSKIIQCKFYEKYMNEYNANKILV